MNAKNRQPTGDSPYNLRNERGSKQSCMTQLGIGGVVVATLVAILKGGKR